MNAKNLARAIELDDDYPPNICPGCLQDVTGWEQFECHYPPGAIVHTPRGIRPHRHDDTWPFNYRQTKGSTCPWNLDYLTARQFRRAYIKQHRTVAA